MKNESQTPDELKEWGSYLLECIRHIGKGKPDEKLLQEVINSMESGLSHYHLKRNIKTLKLMVHEIELWALELDPHDFEVVNKMMFKKFGKNVGEESFLKKIDAVLKRGQIKAIVEYRLLNEFLNSFSGDVSKKEMTEKVTELISSFEVKLNKRKKG
ncbi:MAG TPA: hypothetical protein VI461_00570 [Chitinophagaceae bacterium]|nr:hypothetical protein [Chitinophagaceae bacterium]